jgi:RNA polymerase sigma-70 factor (ECF subfamily)
VSQDERDWLGELDSSDLAIQSAALEELQDYLRRSLAKGFGRQLTDADLDELSQEAIVRVHDKRDTFKGKSRFTTWAAAIAVNLALGELRRKRFKNVSLDEAVSSGRELIEPAHAPEALSHGQLMATLHDGISESLSERQREALLAELAGMPMAEIARRQGTTRGALYKLLHDARKRLRAHLEAQGFDSTDLEPMNAGGIS